MWQYRVFWFNRVPTSWWEVGPELKTWEGFVGMLIPWQEVVAYMNKVGAEDWEIFHIREDYTYNWEEDQLVKGYAASTHRSLAGALGELGASSPARDYEIHLNSAKPDALREPWLIFFYARRKVDET